MQIIAKTKINKDDCYYCKAFVKKDLTNNIPAENVKDIDKNYLGLLKLLEGKEINITFVNSQNLTGRTNEQQLFEIWNNLDKDIKQKHFYLDKNGNSTLFEQILNIFGDGRVGFYIEIENSLSEIETLINNFNTNIKEQFDRYISRPKEEINNIGDYLL